MTETTFDHSQCNWGWKRVHCDRCGREYQCSPSSDFYCTPEGDHCCETCLMGNRPTRIGGGSPS